MYTLTLTDAEYDDICFVGYRYSWSDTLARICGPGENHLTEAEAWEVREAIDEDREGGHSAFPMLDNESDLAEKLASLYHEIV